MTKTKKWLAAGIAGLSLATCIVLLNAGRGKAAVVVETAERRTVPMIVELAARTEAAATVEIRANVEGRLTQMSFREGNTVQKGQVLFQIDPRRCAAAVQLAGAAVERAEADLEMAREQQHLVNAQSALRQAEANLLRSNQDAERMKPLAARRAIPVRDLDAAIAAQSSAQAAVEDARATVRTTTVGDRIGLRLAQANLTAARAARQNAELDLEGTTIRAPISGLIGRMEVSVGNYVGRGESNRLATISPLDPINVDFSISETLYLHTVSTVERAALERIELILSDNSVYPFRGRYTNLARAVDAKTGTLVVEAQFPNPKGLLLPGMSGRVRVSLGTVPDAVLVSERAVFDVPGSKAVYIVTPENRVALRNVVTEGSYQGKSIVTKGLAGGETVIVEGSKVHPGQPVTVETRLRPDGTGKP
jgi:membrane fusion protein (multidrug efflux system)